ncbi:hypothetical protein LXL04_005845 [Taraxacum kok-saghyz]
MLGILLSTAFKSGNRPPNERVGCNTRVLHGLVANEAIERGVHAAKCGDLVANDQGFAEYTIKRTKDKLKLEGTEDHLEGKLEVWDAGIDRHRVIRVLGSRLTTSFSSCSNKGDEETSSSSPTHRSDSPPPGAKPSQPVNSFSLNSSLFEFNSCPPAQNTNKSNNIQINKSFNLSSTNIQINKSNYTQIIWPQGIGDFKTSRTNTSRNLPQFGIEGGIEGLKSYGVDTWHSEFNNICKSLTSSIVEQDIVEEGIAEVGIAEVVTSAAKAVAADIIPSTAAIAQNPNTLLSIYDCLCESVECLGMSKICKYLELELELVGSGGSRTGTGLTKSGSKSKNSGSGRTKSGSNSKNMGSGTRRDIRSHLSSRHHYISLQFFTLQPPSPQARNFTLHPPSRSLRPQLRLAKPSQNRITVVPHLDFAVGSSSSRLFFTLV